MDYFTTGGVYKMLEPMVFGGLFMAGVIIMGIVFGLAVLASLIAMRYISEWCMKRK